MGLFTRAAVDNTGFAVVDLETTGLYPSVDRVVEVGIVHLSPDAEVTAEFCTLINPGRDVGPTHHHKIAASDVYDAPPFAAAAATIWQLLAGRVLVAHNASFDARFLDAEFGRCGVALPPPPIMCTMRLASYYLTGLPARSLPACCNAAGVTLPQWHNALCDAQAAAGLLARYRAAHRQLPGSWADTLTQAAHTPWAPAPRPGQFSPVTRQQQALRRASQRPPLADLVDRLPRGASGDTDTYLGVLDRVLEDRIISADEVLTLSALAAELGLKHDTAQRAHRQYLQHIAAAAWADAHVTETERADLLHVAHLLDVPAAEALTILDGARHALQHPSGHLPPALRPGDRVVFTGDMDMSRANIEALATKAGLRVTTAVSGKTALVVAADPYSQSGKANTARQLGIRLVTEQVFLHLLDHIEPLT